jgi:hypothetical protein
MTSFTSQKKHGERTLGRKYISMCFFNKNPMEMLIWAGPKPDGLAWTNPIFFIWTRI